MVCEPKENIHKNKQTSPSYIAISIVLHKYSPFPCTPAFRKPFVFAPVSRNGRNYTLLPLLWNMGCKSEENGYIQSNIQRGLVNKLFVIYIRIFIRIGRCKQPVSELFFPSLKGETHKRWRLVPLHRIWVWRTQMRSAGCRRETYLKLAAGVQNGNCKDSSLPPLGGVITTIFNGPSPTPKTVIIQWRETWITTLLSVIYLH